MQKILDALSSSEINFDEDLMELSFCNLKMIKVVSLVLRNICLHTDDINIKEVSRSSTQGRKKKKPVITSQTCIIQAGLLRLIIYATRKLVDYEVHVNLYSAISSLLLSP